MSRFSDTYPAAEIGALRTSHDALREALIQLVATLRLQHNYSHLDDKGLQAALGDACNKADAALRLARDV